MIETASNHTSDEVCFGAALDGIVAARVDGDIGDLALDLVDLDFDVDIAETDRDDFDLDDFLDRVRGALASLWHSLHESRDSPILLIGDLLNHDLAIAQAKANHDHLAGRLGTDFCSKSLEATNGP